MSDIAKAIFNRFGGEVTSRYYDVLVDNYDDTVETRTGDEIISSIKDKIKRMSEE